MTKQIKTPDHLFISECNGALYDTRKPDYLATPLRSNFKRHHTHCQTLADVKATLRQGPFAWPGGYPLYFVTKDAAALCFDCARKEFRQVAWDFLNDCSTGWRIEASDVNYECNDLVCDHCSKSIEPAYGN